MAKMKAIEKRRMGRPTKAQELQALDALNKTMPPEKIAEVIEKTWEWCQLHKSVNGSIKLLELILNYQLGQPVKRVLSTKMSIDDLLASVSGVDDEEFDNAIDAIYSNSDK